MTTPPPPQNNFLNSYKEHSRVFLTSLLQADMDIEVEINDMNNTLPSVQLSTHTNYISLNTLKELKHSAIAHLNIRSFDANGKALNDILTESGNNLSVIAISEMWKYKAKDKPMGYQPPTMILRPNNNGGGGVAIFCKNGIVNESINNLCYINDNIEICTVKTKLANRSRLISCIYKPPTTSLSNFCQEMRKILTWKDQNFPGLDYDLLGDYNLCLKNINNNRTISDLLNQFGYELAINRPTRIKLDSMTVIDYIISNCVNEAKFYILPTSLSDHFMIIKSMNSQRQTKKSIQCRIYKEETIIHFKTLLLHEDWNDVISESDHDNKWNLFFQKTDILFNEAFPTKTVKVHEKVIDKPWCNDELILDYAKERKLFLKSKNSRTRGAMNRHLDFKKALEKKVRIAKRIYTEQQFQENKGNPKETWKIINQLINKNTETNRDIEKIVVNGTTITEKNEIANNFNTFFAGIGHQLEQNIPSNQNEYDEYINSYLQEKIEVPSFKFKNVSLADIIKLGKSIKPKMSAGPDNIPSKVSKIMIMTIPQVYQSLINSSLNSGKVHQRLKDANIVPIFKKGDKACMNNYRPISLITSTSKILEKVVTKQLRDHLTANNLYFAAQFGFRPKHNTTMALLTCVEKYKDLLCQRKAVRSIFIDLTKAFDTVKHNILLDKLKAFGVNGIELDWFRNYLANRRQQCKIDGRTSQWEPSSIGVPQGSILGPLLFAIFINDLPSYIKKVERAQQDCGNLCHLFADDTEITVYHSDNNQLHTYANKIIKIAQKWMKINKLTLNPSKTRTIKFSRNPSPTPLIDGTPITEVFHNNPDTSERSFRFLGFQIDNKLDFKAHTQYVINKLNSANFILRRVKNQIGTRQKICIYNSLFRSQFEYGISIWSRGNNIDRIEKLQKRAILAVDGPSKKRHTEPVFKRHGLLKVKHIRDLNDIGLAHSIIHNYAPDLLQKYLKKKQPHPLVNTRRNLLNLVDIQADQSSICKWLIPDTWNNLDNDLKTIDKIGNLKIKLKKKYLNDYTSNPICPDRECWVCK